MLKGLGDIGKMGGMLKQAMEMKGKMEELKEQLGDERVEAASGGLPQIVEHARSLLARHEVPRRWIAVDALPLLPNGKPDRSAARTLAS